MAQKCKSSSYSCRGPKLCFQHSHGGSQPCVIQGIQHTLLVSKGIRHTSGAQIYRQAKHPYTKNDDDELQRKAL